MLDMLSLAASEMEAGMTYEERKKEWEQAQRLLVAHVLAAVRFNEITDELIVKAANKVLVTRESFFNGDK